MKNKVEAAAAHDAEVTGKTQPLLEHVLALRKLLICCIIAVVVGFALAFYLLSNRLIDFIEAPILARGISIINTSISKPLTTQLKVSLVAGVVCASPYIIFELWRYIKPALYDNEVRLVRSLFVVALFLFLLGVAFCYLCVYDLAISFFVTTADGISTPMLDIGEYVDFLFAFLLPFGVVFELPVALFITTRMGLTNGKGLAKARKYVFFGIFVLAAILTPPDVVSQIMLGVPMYLLFEVGILVARVTKPRQPKEES